MQSETGFPSSHQLNSYVASESGKIPDYLELGTEKIHLWINIGVGWLSCSIIEQVLRQSRNILVINQNNHNDSSKSQ